MGIEFVKHLHLGGCCNGQPAGACMQGEGESSAETAGQSP